MQRELQNNNFDGSHKVELEDNAQDNIIAERQGMDMLLKKDVGQNANHATSNTP
jgi:hypothetical protein